MSKTSKRIKRTSAVATMLLAGLLVGACGGSSDSSDSSGSPSVSADPPAGAGGPVARDTRGGSVPAEASSDVRSMLTWAKSLSRSETSEPYSTKTFRPPLDDTTETSPG